MFFGWEVADLSGAKEPHKKPGILFSMACLGCDSDVGAPVWVQVME